jgi:hypothetical protein
VLYNFRIDPEWGATYPFPADARKTILAKCEIANGKLAKLSFVPAVINKLNQPQLLSRADDDFDKVVKFLQWSCEDQNLPTKLSPQDNEVVICM